LNITRPRLLLVFYVAHARYQRGVKCVSFG
jgi:hypothetical protein